MVLPSVDNKNIKKTTEDPSPTESKLNIIDSDNFLSWIIMKKHTLLYWYALIVNIKYFPILWIKMSKTNVTVSRKLWRQKTVFYHILGAVNVEHLLWSCILYCFCVLTLFLLFWTSKSKERLEHVGGKWCGK
jgi:hypothetical protein